MRVCECSFLRLAAEPSFSHGPYLHLELAAAKRRVRLGEDQVSSPEANTTVVLSTTRPFNGSRIGGLDE